jgi:uncharacterized protein YjaG (DUF416 family)
MMYLTETKKSIKGCSERDLMIFMGLSIELLMPIYLSFSKRVNWGSVQILEEITTTLYSTAFIRQPEPKYLEMLKEELYLQSPDLDEIDDRLASYALDVCIAADEAVSFLISPDLNHFTEFVTNIFNLLDMYVQEKNDLDPNEPNIEKIIMKDIFVEREVKRQVGLLSRLKQKKVSSLEDIQGLRDDFQQEIIDLSLLPY